MEAHPSFVRAYGVVELYAVSEVDVHLSLVVHLVMTALFSHTYDSEYWLIIMQNIETGTGLYGLNGFYYTPVWGYMLSFADMLTQVFGAIPVLGDRFTDLIVIEDYNGFQAVLASPDINFLLKLPLSVCDVLVGYLLYVIVSRHTGSERKGIVSMALWCFCPIVVYMSAIQGQFDTISVLLLLMTIFLIRQDNPLLAGMVFALATWLKIFPGVCILVLFGYMLARYKGAPRSTRQISMSIVGFLLLTAVLFLPQILDGTLAYAFSFLTSRTSGYDLGSTLYMAGMLVIIVVLMLFMTRSIARKPAAEADRLVFLYCGLLASLAAMVQFGYQYAPSIVGFIILFAMMSVNTRGYRFVFLVVSLFTFLEAFFWVNYSSLFIISEYFGTFDPSWVLEHTLDFTLNWGSEATGSLMGRFANIWHYALFAFVIMAVLDFCRGRVPVLDRASDYVRSLGGLLR